MEDKQEPSSSDSHAIVVDVPSLAQALEQELAVRRQLLNGGSQACTLTIGLVHDLTRNVDEHEYNPHHVSIGLYHWKRIPNISRDDDKLASLDTILSASRRSGPNTPVEVYLAELAEIEDRARSFYGHRFNDMKSLEFQRMMLLDACYVIDWFGNVVIPENGSSAANGLVERGHQDSSTASAAGDGNVVRENGSPVANGHVQEGYQDSSTPSAEGGGNKLETVLVLRDVLYLAENQIPYFVVDKIHNLTFSGGRPALVNTIAGHISCILQKQQYSMVTVVDMDDAPPPEPGNLLHLLHMHFPKPTTVSSSRTGEPVGRRRTAMEYYINGVNFKSRTVGMGAMEARCILDVMMDRGSGTLVVPRLKIDSETWRILRNMMALEQQNPAVGSHVTAYCLFMSQLVCTARDVEFLSRSGVIVHLLGNKEEVAKLFSDLCKGVVFDADDPDLNYLRANSQALDELYRSRPRRWVALLVHKYSANPWLAVGVMAAALRLVGTMVQAVYAVLSYFQGEAK